MSALAPPPVSTMFLSRLRLNLRDRDVRADLANSQAMHRRLLDAFPQPSREGNGVLYRVDPVRGGRYTGAMVIVQSALRPDWSRLPEGYLRDDGTFGWDLNEVAPVKPIDQHYAGITPGDVFRFRLRANPTKRIPWNVWQAEHPADAAKHLADGRKPNGPRVPVTMLTGAERALPPEQRPSAEDKLREWLDGKARQHGFRVADVRSMPDPLSGDMQYGTKRDDMRLSHKAIVFEGLLQVTDADTFRQALRCGIGAGKAYGFGLLSIARIAGERQ